MTTPTSTTPIQPSNPEMRSHLLSHYTTLLSNFSTSTSKFKILTSLPHISPTSPSPPPPPPKTLYILDSSFNPPTLAHLHIAQTALLHDPANTSSSSSSQPPQGKHLLLVLATTNADKKDPSPASFPQRLCMLRLLAETLLLQSRSKTTPTAEAEDLTIDIGVTKQPYFIDKSISILEDEEDQAVGKSRYTRDTEQVHLLGYDTLVRLLDVKYYPPEHTLAPLLPFLERHRLLVTYRGDDKWGGREEQDGFLEGVEGGALDTVGGLREWVGKGRIRMVEGKNELGEAISSTRVREAAGRGDAEVLGRFVPKTVGEWVLREGLYR